jgi:putative DNA primase/helicase
MIVLENKERATARQVFAILGGRRINHYSFICHCPCRLHAHGDRNPSLSVRDGDRGRLLLHCFAGDSYDDVAAALRAKGIRL